MLDSTCRSLRITDFGAAARWRDRHKFNEMAGTPPFMAPEVVRAKCGHGYNLKCDIWSLGCVVIEMATGRLPWLAVGEQYNRYGMLFKVR